eukprot:GILJ01009072.1.p1 GENE.GILJ01009072.1~~GILJ01009072.1.p1  ORF type:complete len:243 (+),score=24.23 GILJ01009072.1:42-731(+)
MADSDSEDDRRPCLPVSECLPPTGEATTAEEYLAQVRHQARALPKVVVADIDTRQFDHLQTSSIPDTILNPPKTQAVHWPGMWLDHFLSDFADLRLAISRHIARHKARRTQQQQVPHVKDEEGWRRFCASAERTPSLSIISSLDHVSTRSLLQYQLEWLCSSSSLSEPQVAWLFAVLARLDKPLDPDIAASLFEAQRHLLIMETDNGMQPYRQVLLAIIQEYFGQKPIE